MCRQAVVDSDYGSYRRFAAWDDFSGDPMCYQLSGARLSAPVGARPKALAATALALVLAAGGCLKRSAPPSAGPEHAAAVVVNDSPPEFIPKVVTVKVGDTVQWINTGQIAHNVTFLADEIPAGAAAADSGSIEPQNTFSYTFTVPGTYPYVCRFHTASGMAGQVDVIPAVPVSTASASATAASQ